MNKPFTQSNRDKVIDQLIDEIDQRISQIMDMPDDGFVCMFDVDGSCVDSENFTHRNAMSSGCLTRATIYTLEQLDACSEYGLGIPCYRNGNGDFARLVTVRDAKWRQLRDANEAIDHLALLKSNGGANVR